MMMRFIRDLFACPARPSVRKRARPASLQMEVLEQRDCPSASDWVASGFDPQGSRNNTHEHTLSPANVAQLGVAWTFPTPAPVSGTPAVVDDVVYAGDFAGNFYAVNADNGKLIWQWHQTYNIPVSDSPLVTKGVVVFGDLGGNVYGLDAKTGSQLWATHPADPTIKLSAIYGSPTQVGNYVAIGTSSGEESGVPPGYQYTARGSVVLLDPIKGKIVWQTSMIPDAAYAAGWRGSSVWDTPTYDKQSNLIYVATGNYFTAGAKGTDPGTEDAVIALNATTGHIVWVNELVKGDIWNGNIVPGPDNPDADIADSPKIFELANGTKVVSAGSKDGFYFVMDAATGKPINGPDGLQLEVGGVLGGLYATGAVDQKDSIVFENGVNWPNLGTADPDQTPAGGDLYAVSLDGKTKLWDFKTPGPNGSGVAIANGVVYVQSLDGTLYALDAKAPDAEHALLASFQTGGNYSGPAVADGHVYLGTGAIIPQAPYTQYHNGITALGLPPAEVKDLRADQPGLGAALTSANLLSALGWTDSGLFNKAVNEANRVLNDVVIDLASVIGVDAPSTKALKNDFRSFFLALSTGNVTRDQSALAKVKADFEKIFTALSTPAVDQSALAAQQAALIAALDSSLTDELAHNLAGTAHDSADEFAALGGALNDLLARRYGVTL